MLEGTLSVYSLCLIIEETQSKREEMTSPRLNSGPKRSILSVALGFLDFREMHSLLLIVVWWICASE